MSKLSSILVVLLFSFCACNNSAPQNKAEFKMASTDQAAVAETSADHLFASPDATNFTSEPMRAAEESPEINEQNISKTTDKKIIKDGSMSIRTKDIESSKKTMDGIVKQLQAYYEGENLRNDDRTIAYDLKIRIPSAQFEQLITAIEKGEDEIISKNITARDVTEEYVDIETRLMSKRAYLQRYTELLSKAKTVDDILSIEENIRTIQEEIESNEGRLKYLKDQVAFSTLSINLFKDKEYIYKEPQKDKFSERVKNAASSGWWGLVDFIVGLFVIWPWLLILSIAYIIIRRIVKRMRNRS